MTHSLTTSDLLEEMQELSSLNKTLHALFREELLWGGRYSQCSMTYSTEWGECRDSKTTEPPSAHARLQFHTLRARRNTKVIALTDHLMRDLPGLYVGKSRISITLSFTPAGNPTVDLKIEGISVHERPVSPRTLAPKIVELADCLAHHPLPSGQSRPFVVAHIDTMPAATPELAIWKWLCLRHRRQAQELARMRPGERMPNHQSLAYILENTTLREDFSTPRALEGALGLHR